MSVDPVMISCFAEWISEFMDVMATVPCLCAWEGCSGCRNHMPTCQTPLSEDLSRAITRVYSMGRDERGDGTDVVFSLRKKLSSGGYRYPV